MGRRVPPVLLCLLAAVTALCATALPATAAAAIAQGTVVARFTGQPVPGACVTLFDSARTEVAGTCADADGAYRFDDSVPPGRYRVRATADGYADTWYGTYPTTDARDFESADEVWFSGQWLELGLRPPGAGTIRGQLTDRGAPVSGWRVEYVDVDGNHWGSRTATTDAEGRYTFAGLWSGHYKLKFTDSINTQYYHQKDSLAEADVLVVAGEGDTVVEEELIAPGTVEVALADEVTGAPVQRFCAFAPGSGSGETPCTIDGVLRFELPRGRYRLVVNAAPEYFSADVDGVVVTSGQTTEVSATARPGLAVHSTVRDAATGTPVAGTCVRAVAAAAPGIRTWDTDDACSDERGEITVGPLTPGDYRLLVTPGDTTYGMQWLGTDGGTGDQERARRVTGTPGTLTELGDIRLDKAGTITGTVRDESTGAPVAQVCVFPYATDWGYGDSCTDQNGRYEITGLGPYHWPLEYTDTGETYGWRWSGDQPNRLRATRTKVWPGRTTTADERLRPAASVTGVVTVDGADFSIVSVGVYDAQSGDYAGPFDSGTPDFTLGNLGAQAVKISYRDADTGAAAWYLNATSAGTARSVYLRPGRTTTLREQVLHP
jgi:hypothetical protein